MVRVGFIVEGTSDFIVLKDKKFRKFLKYKFDIDFDETNIINARSYGNLKAHLESYINSLLKKEVDYIFVLVDQDNKERKSKKLKYSVPNCPIRVVEEIKARRAICDRDNIIFIVMTLEMEAWFIADYKLGYSFDGDPESIDNPSEYIQKIEETSNHVLIAKRLASKFSLRRAAEKSKSANRFLNKLAMLKPKEESTIEAKDVVL